LRTGFGYRSEQAPTRCSRLSGLRRARERIQRPHQGRADRDRAGNGSSRARGFAGGSRPHCHGAAV